MSDLISRQALIEAIVNTPSLVQDETIPLTTKYDGATFRQIEILGIIESMPTADVAETRRGHWSDISGQACVCSACGKPQNYKQANGWRYCPHCGSVME